MKLTLLFKIHTFPNANAIEATIFLTIDKMTLFESLFVMQTSKEDEIYSSIDTALQAEAQIYALKEVHVSACIKIEM